jgi:hypothetical protein
MHFIFELLLQPVLELLFYGVGYATAWVVVPLFTFGRVTVEPARNIDVLRPQPRIGPRRYVIDGVAAALVGWLFWIVVAVIAWSLARG